MAGGLNARAMAAEGMMGGAGGGGMGGGMPPEEALPPPEEMAPPGGGAGDLDSALAGVEAALEGLDPQVAEEARSHLNAIRELAASGGAPPGADTPLPPEGPAPDGGAGGMPEEPMPK